MIRVGIGVLLIVEKCAKKEETTDNKRFTFLLGPGQSCRTAADNFIALYEIRESLEIKNIRGSFQR